MNASLFGDNIAVIGSGHVGLVTAAIFSAWDHNVTCVDNNDEKIKLLNQGLTYFHEPSLNEALFEKNKSISFKHTNEIKYSEYDIIYICLPTPPDEEGKCDISLIENTIDEINSVLTNEKIVCIKSTVSPGTMSKLQNHLNGNENNFINLVYNPEFMREGSAFLDFELYNPVIIASPNTTSRESIHSLFKDHIVDESRYILTDFQTAELIKYGWNASLALRITFFNELSRICNKTSADINSLIKAISMSEKALPTQNIHVGPGFGGSCFPKDVLAFSKTFESYGFDNSLAKQIIALNDRHIEIMADMIWEMVESNSNPVVSCLGITFKANTSDIRNSPASKILSKLKEKGCSINGYDRLVTPMMINEYPDVNFFDTPYEALQGSDCLVILTNDQSHQNLDLELVAKIMRTKNIFDPINIIEIDQNLDTLGFRITNLGRSVNVAYQKKISQ